MEEQVKANRDMIKEATKELDKELFRLDFENRNLQNQIKTLATKNQADVARIHAKSLVRNKHAIRRYCASKANSQCLSLRMLSISTMQSMTKAMSQSANIMQKLNVQLKVPEMAKMMNEFSKQNEKLQDKQDMMDEMMDDAFEVDGEEKEMNDEVDQCIAEACGGIMGPNKVVQDPMQVKAGATMEIPKQK